MSDKEPITALRQPVRLEYHITAGEELSRFLTTLTQKRIMGTYFPGADETYVPPRSMCPTNGETGGEEVEIGQIGTVTTFAVINIPFEGQRLEPPYVCAAIVPDGADLPLFHIIAGVKPEDCRMGMRVRAVWVDDDELAPTLESIKYFEPVDEPDAPYEAYAEHL